MQLRMLLILLILTHSSFCQTGKMVGQIHLTDSLLHFEELDMNLKLGDSIKARTIPDPSGHYTFKSVTPGNYKLVIQTGSEIKQAQFVIQK